jgi:peptidyl-prolyl cis-trans isomerase SurA
MLQRFYFSGFLVMLCSFSAFAQTIEKKNIDKIIVVVGDHVALQSEVNQVMAEYLQQDANMPDTMNCTILEGILTKYLLCEQAARDSVMVSDEEVEANLENRIRYMEQQYGSAEEMERITGKTEFQIKDDYRRFFKDLMISQRMQGQIQQNVKISPAEVRTFFDKIPKDSLPMYPSMVELGQIVLAPTASQEADDYTKQRLLELKKDIMEGKSDFETMASIYSQDPGSKDLGGNLGIVTRDQMVPEFSAAGFRLQNGEISDPVKTKYGYHIIQMMQRMGEKAKMRHILIKPTITASDVANCQQKLDSIRTLVVSGKMTFITAVNKFSTDENTKNTGGMIVNPSTGSSLLTIEELGADLALSVGELKPGEYSSVKIFDAAEGQPTSSATINENKQCRFLYLKNMNEPHIANISTDFNRIQLVALEDKRNKFIYNWVDTKIGDFYIYIDPSYQDCTSIDKWMKARNKE